MAASLTPNSNPKRNTDHIKSLIRQNLVTSIKNIQTSFNPDDPGTPIRSQDDVANSLCHAIESIFLHGIKNSLVSSLWRKSDVREGVNFWHFVMIISHRSDLERVTKLKQINTDIGKCRAWIRLTLNDGQFGSYLATMVREKESLRKFYERNSFMRDSDCLEIAHRYILGLEMFKFDLALNSSLLNRWQTIPLALAGLWNPEVLSRVSTPVRVRNVIAPEPQKVATEEEEAEDVLKELENKNPNSASGFQPPKYFGHGLLNEDEALRLILKCSSSSHSLANSNSTSNQSSAVGSPKTSDILSVEHSGKKSKHHRKHRDSPLASINTIVENNDNAKENVSLSKQEDDIKMERANAVFMPEENREIQEDDCVSQGVVSVLNESTESVGASIYKSQQSYESVTNTRDVVVNKEEEIEEAEEPPQQEQSTKKYSKVMDSYVEQLIDNMEKDIKAKRELEAKKKREEEVIEEEVEAVSCKTNKVMPCLSGFIDSWRPFSNLRFFDTPPNSAVDSKDLNSFHSYDMHPDVSVGPLNVQDSHDMMKIFDKLTSDEGLDEQSYECHNCSKAIGTIFGSSKFCDYLKKYFCSECHIDDVSIIPAKVVYNWDFKKYKVSRKSKAFLDAIKHEPVIDSKDFDSNLLEFAPELEQAISLRKRLFFINAYLGTCSQSGQCVRQDFFDKFLKDKEYLAKETEKFSISDFEDIDNGTLLSKLNQAEKLGEDHVVKCVLCSGKGFICEVCRDPTPVYPFHVDSISQCQKCYSVFHLECSLQLQSCPKCDRRDARNLNWHVTNCRLEREIASES